MITWCTSIEYSIVAMADDAIGNVYAHQAIENLERRRSHAKPNHSIKLPLERKKKQ
jgi:hypothetical protein